MRLLSRPARAVARALPAVVRDLAGLAGAGLIAYGAWLLSAPAGFVVAGAFLLLGALLIGKAP